MLGRRGREDGATGGGGAVAAVGPVKGDDDDDDDDECCAFPSESVPRDSVSFLEESGVGGRG